MVTTGLPRMHCMDHVAAIVHLCFSPLSWFILVLSPLPLAQSVSYRVLPASLDPPKNLSITAVTPHRATIKWMVSEQQGKEHVTRFEMTIFPVQGTRYSQKTVTDVDGGARSFTFQELRSETEYTLYIIAYNAGSMSNRSDVITFRTSADISPAEVRSVHVQPGEIILVIIIIIAWFCAIALFLHKWGRIRILQPGEPRYKHNPKNLETIKVVKRPTDSVIYRSYPKQLCRTMLAREKRIERMNTMPNIKLGETSQITKKDKFKSSLPVIEMEDFLAESSSCFQLMKKDKSKSSLPIIETEELLPEPSTSHVVTVEKSP